MKYRDLTPNVDYIQAGDEWKNDSGRWEAHGPVSTSEIGQLYTYPRDSWCKHRRPILEETPPKCGHYCGLVYGHCSDCNTQVTPNDKYGTRIQDGDEYEVSEGVWEKVHPDSVGLPQSLFTNYRRPPLDLSEGEQLSVWISVEDALPDDTDDVLVLCASSSIPDAAWYCVDKGWQVYSSAGWESVDDVTHWHPAPPLPESKPAVDPDEEACARFIDDCETTIKRNANYQFVARTTWRAALAYARKAE